MNKRHLHHQLTNLKRLHSIYFIILILVAGTVFVFAYRQNNLQAIQLRDHLLEVDKQNGNVETALKDLRTYTYAHMNANLSGGSNNIYPPIQLKYRYERLVQAEKARVEAINAPINANAVEYCDRPAQVNKRGTVPRDICMRDFVSSYGAAYPQAIPDAMYKFDFVSPMWSPDRAGWSLVITVVLVMAYAVRMAGEWYLRYSLRG